MIQTLWLFVTVTLIVLRVRSRLVQGTDERVDMFIQIEARCNGIVGGTGELSDTSAEFLISSTKNLLQDQRSVSTFYWVVEAGPRTQ